MFLLEKPIIYYKGLLVPGICASSFSCKISIKIETVFNQTITSQQYILSKIGRRKTVQNLIRHPGLYRLLVSLKNIFIIYDVASESEITFSRQKYDFKVILMPYDKKNLTFVLLYYLIY